MLERMSTYCAAFAVLLGVVNSYCNYGVWNYMPLSEGECGVCFGDDCGAFLSAQVVCGATGENATLYQYSDYGCSSVINMTSLEYFDCGASGDCDYYDDAFDLLFLDLNDTDCAGSVENIISLPVALSVESAPCLNFSGFYGSLEANLTQIFITIYLDSACAGTSYGTSAIFNTYDCNNGTLTFFNERIMASNDTTTMYPYYTTEDGGDGSATLYGTCNYGLWEGVWPIAEGYCASCDGDGCDETKSMYMFCSSGDGYLFYLNETGCGGSVIGYEMLDYAFCNASMCSTDELTLMGLTEYEDYGCGGDEELEASFPLAQYSLACFGFDLYSYAIYFGTDSLMFGLFSGDNCNGTLIGNVTTLGDEYCDNSTMYEFNDNVTSGIISSDFDCDFGLWNWWPMADDWCGTCDGGNCDGTGSVSSMCNSDGDEATLYEYYDMECSDEKNETELDVFVCGSGNSGSDCEDDVIVLGITGYTGTGDCDGGSGEVDFNATLYLASGSMCVRLVDDYSIYYISVDANADDGIMVYGYLDEFCNGQILFNQTFENGYCESEGDGNSTMWTFSAYGSMYTTTSSSSGSSNTTSSDTGGTSGDGAISLEFFTAASLFATIVAIVATFQ